MGGTPLLANPVARLDSTVAFTSAVKDFISYRRYETMSLHSIMQGLSTTTCRWTVYGTAQTAHIPLSDSIKRRELLEEFIVWYFGSFVVPLLRVSGIILSVFLSSLKSIHRPRST